MECAFQILSFFFFSMSASYSSSSFLHPLIHFLFDQSFPFNPLSSYLPKTLIQGFKEGNRCLRRKNIDNNTDNCCFGLPFGSNCQQINWIIIKLDTSWSLILIKAVDLCDLSFVSMDLWLKCINLIQTLIACIGNLFTHTFPNILSLATERQAHIMIMITLKVGRGVIVECVGV